MAYRERDSVYPAFDEVKDESRRAYDDFVETNLLKPAEGWEDLYRYAAYTIWSHRSGVCGNFLEPMVFMHLVWANYAMSWQQSLQRHAHTEKSNREAWRLIKVMFNYQVPNGQISGSVNYHGIGIGGMQPAFQALALDWIFSQCGDDWLTYEDCEEMYPKFVKWLDFWQGSQKRPDTETTGCIFSPPTSRAGTICPCIKKGFPIERRRTSLPT